MWHIFSKLIGQGENRITLNKPIGKVSPHYPDIF